MSDCSSASLSDLGIETCSSGGTYDPAMSTTGADGGSSLSYDYLDGSSVAADLHSDTITLPTGALVPDLRFGVAVKSSGFTNGILGLGYGQASGTDGQPTFLDQLASQKITNSKAFSLALGGAGPGDSGVIIFGGVDTRKFSGTLAPTDIIKPTDGRYAAGFYYVGLTGVGVGGGAGGDPKTYAGSDAVVALGSADTISYLPGAIVDELNGDVGNGSACAPVGDACVYPVSCARLRDDGLEVRFAFGDVSVGVPLAELVLDGGGDTCLLGIAALDESRVGTASLGANFLRSAYVVFDQTLDQVSLAQYVDCGRNEQEVPSSGAAGFEGECQLASTSATYPPSSTSAVSSPSPASAVSSPSSTRLATEGGTGGSSTGNTAVGLTSGAESGAAFGVAAFGLATVCSISFILL